jgi:phosphatidylserine/phosphatidylglycerophosphate/cardiolipin synthase-like enzyme
VSGESTVVYCTWAHRKLLPPHLRMRFGDLDDFVRSVVGTAQDSVLLISPYLSPPGLAGLRGAMAMAVERGAWIHILTDDSQPNRDLNSRALRELVRGDEGELVRRRLRVLTASALFPVLVHAKAVVVDASSGYLGSANLSQRGLDENFEIGLALSAVQANTIAKFAELFEARKYIEDVTTQMLGIPPRLGL